MDALDRDIEEISHGLVTKQHDFDHAMDLARRAVRNSGVAITMLHNNDIAGARRLVDEISKMIGELSGADAQFKYNTAQAYQEYAEAAIFIGIKEHGTIPSKSAIGVGGEAYLMGLMDVVGELKRDVLEALRAGDIDTAETHFGMMRHIYDSTRSVRFAEAVLGGFRRKQDTARIQLEGAGGEILSFRNAHVDMRKRETPSSR